MAIQSDAKTRYTISICVSLYAMYTWKKSVSVYAIQIYHLLSFMTFLEREKKKQSWHRRSGGGVAFVKCSHWGSKVECKCLSLSNPTHFIFVTEKSVQGPQHFFSNCQGVICQKKKRRSETESPPPVLLYVVRLQLFETRKVGACKEHTWTWRPVTSNTHTTWSCCPAESPLAGLLTSSLTLLCPIASSSIDEQ